MKKILVVRNDRFGEFLLNIPALRALKERFPEAHLTVAVGAALVPLARAVPFVDAVFCWPLGPKNLHEKWTLAASLRTLGFSVAFVLNPSSEAHQVVFLACIPRRVGYGRKYGFLLTDRLLDHPSRLTRHEVDNNLDLVRLLGAETKDKTLVLNLPPEGDKILQILGVRATEAFVVVHPWTSDPVKQWPLESFRVLVRDLSRVYKIVIIGKPEAWHGNFDIKEYPAVIDRRGETSLLEAATLMKHAQVLVSCDSGPVHLAAAVGTPVVALFRNDLPGKTAQRWGPWGVKNVVLESSDLSSLAVGDVVGAVRAIIEKKDF